MTSAMSLEEACTNALAPWRFNTLSSSIAAELKLPEQFDAATRFVRVEDLEAIILISDDLGWPRPGSPNSSNSASATSTFTMSG